MLNKTALKPIAPKGSTMAVSLDPKDYVYPSAPAVQSGHESCYVWGMPPNAGVMQQTHAYMHPFMAAAQGSYQPCGSVMGPWCGQHYGQASGMAPCNSGHMQGQMYMLPHQPSSSLARQDSPMKADLDQGAEPLLPGERDLLQVPPQLSGADELLDIPLDEDCLQRLLSGDVADDIRAKGKAMEVGPSDSGKADGSAVSASTGEAKDKKQSGEEGASSGAASGAEDELLNTKDLNFFGNASVINHVDSFADVNLEYLTSIHELETASSHDMLSFPDEAALSPKSRDKRQSVIARTKSEAALPGTGRSPLAGQRPDAALQSILDYLASEALSAAPGDKRQSAVEALKELQQTLKGSSAGSGEMNRSPSMTKRKRAGPARTSSAKTLKAEPMA